MKQSVESMIDIMSVDRPDYRAEQSAMTIMSSAFSKAYGEAWTAAQLSGFMSLPGVRLSLARIEGAALGFSLSRQIIDEAELLLIATDPKWRGRGVGTALLKDFIAYSRKSRVTTLHLEVRDNNPAIDFYSRHGFENILRRPSYYRGSDGRCYDALSFKLSII
ncbi:MAG: GNAT family N-acetyltransferase [Sphingobium sp.]